MHRLISHKGIGYYFFLWPCHFTENSKRAFLMLVTKIQHPKIFKWKKKNDQVTKKKKKKKKKCQPQGMKTWHLHVHFRWISWSVKAIHIEGRGRIPVSVACFNCSIAEVWTANTCLTTACLANNGAVAGVKSTLWITTVLLTCYR